MGLLSVPTIPIQNRKVVRLRCNYQVRCSMYGQRFTAKVVDMGLKGMRLELPCRVERGQLLSVQYDGPFGCYDLDTVQASVVWSHLVPATQTSIVGVCYTNPPAYLERSWVKHLLRVFDLEHVTPHDRRRHVRVPVTMLATIDSAAMNDVQAKAVLRDIGLGGALLECEVEVPVGASVRIQTESGKALVFEGSVTRASFLSRSKNWRIGIRFAAASNGPSPDLCACLEDAFQQP